MIDFDMQGTYKYLFLDRDGVINVERPNDYVKNIDEFVFIDGALEAISILSSFFSKIFIVTNQRGIGRGVYSEESLHQIHEYMLGEIEKNKGHVDKIYYDTEISDLSINRKPNVGMAFKAKEDFPELKFENSIMIGNSKSDIYFGKKLNMFTILVGDKYKAEDTIYQFIDKYYENLLTFGLDILKIKQK